MPNRCRAAPANDRVVLASVGVRGRGTALATGFAERPDCRIAYVCDVDSNLFPAFAKKIAPLQGGKEPVGVQDFRRALDDKTVDAIVVATPDHWHCLATIWGCQAGKDVYVEKPVSHSPWEGRKAVEAARKYKRIVQVGTQNRSAPYLMAAKKYLDEGRLGRIHLCRVYDQKGGGESLNNFPAAADGDPPDGFDWDMWNGPAPEGRYNTNSVNHWHSLWRYSGGDICNDASHQLDLARWLMGVEYPKAVYCSGLPYGTEGVAETPETQIVNYDFDNLIDDPRNDAVHAVHAEGLAADSAIGDGFPLLAAVRLADGDLWQRGSHVRRPARRRLAGLHSPEIGEAGAQGAAEGTNARSAAQGELHPVHSQPRVAQRRRRERAPQRPAVALPQHQLPPGRTKAAGRSEDRAVRRQPGSLRPAQADVPKAVGRAGRDLGARAS